MGSRGSKFLANQRFESINIDPDSIVVNGREARFTVIVTLDTSIKEMPPIPVRIEPCHTTTTTPTPASSSTTPTPNTNLPDDIPPPPPELRGDEPPITIPQPQSTATSTTPVEANLSIRETRLKKLDILEKLLKLVDEGYGITKEYSLDDDLQTLQNAYDSLNNKKLAKNLPPATTTSSTTPTETITPLTSTQPASSSTPSQTPTVSTVAPTETVKMPISGSDIVDQAINASLYYSSAKELKEQMIRKYFELVQNKMTLDECQVVELESLLDLLHEQEKQEHVGKFFKLAYNEIVIPTGIMLPCNGEGLQLAMAPNMSHDKFVFDRNTKLVRKQNPLENERTLRNLAHQLFHSEFVTGIKTVEGTQIYEVTNLDHFIVVTLRHEYQPPQNMPVASAYDRLLAGRNAQDLEFAGMFANQNVVQDDDDEEEEDNAQIEEAIRQSRTQQPAQPIQATQPTQVNFTISDLIKNMSPSK